MHAQRQEGMSPKNRGCAGAKPRQRKDAKILEESDVAKEHDYKKYESSA